MHKGCIVNIALDGLGKTDKGVILECMVVDPKITLIRPGITLVIKVMFL